MGRKVRNVENEDKNFNPIQNEDELLELQHQIRESEAIKKMLESEGWSKVLKPKLDERIGELLKMFTKAKDYSDFVMIQQAISAIENIMNFCKTVIAFGDAAAKRIELDNENSRKTE